MPLNPILYAEDEPDDAFFLERALRIAGIPNPLVVVPSGERAIDYIAGRGQFSDRTAHPFPSLLLLDLNLPLKSGLEVLKWMGTQPALPSLPVVVLTSSTQDEDRGRASDLGVRDFFSKPVDPRELTEMVRVIKDRYFKA